MVRRLRIAIVPLALAVVAAATTGGGSPARGVRTPLDCAGASEALRKAAPRDRVELAVSILDQKCQPLPAEIPAAMRSGSWWDGSALPAGDRLSLVARGTGSGYSEAETLAVTLLEDGRWPGGAEIHIEEGLRLIAALAPVRHPYRARLLLDIYEQQPADPVRIAVVRALHGSTLPEAALPALDASFGEAGPLQAAAMETLVTKERRDERLAQLLRELPEGPAREWAKRLSLRRGQGPAVPR